MDLKNIHFPVFIQSNFTGFTISIYLATFSQNPNFLFKARSASLWLTEKIVVSCQQVFISQSSTSLSVADPGRRSRGSPWRKKKKKKRRSPPPPPPQPHQTYRSFYYFFETSCIDRITYHYSTMEHALHLATYLNFGTFHIVLVGGQGGTPTSAHKAVLLAQHMIISAFWTPRIKNSWIHPSSHLLRSLYHWHLLILFIEMFMFFVQISCFLVNPFQKSFTSVFLRWQHILLKNKKKPCPSAFIILSAIL